MNQMPISRVHHNYNSFFIAEEEELRGFCQSIGSKKTLGSDRIPGNALKMASAIRSTEADMTTWHAFVICPLLPFRYPEGNAGVPGDLPSSEQLRIPAYAAEHKGDYNTKGKQIQAKNDTPDP